MPVSPSNALIRKKALLDVGVFDERFSLHEDYDLWIRLISKYKFETIFNPLVEHYDWEGGISKIASPKTKIECKKLLLKKHSELYKKFPEAKSVVLRNIGTEFMLTKKTKKGIIYFLKTISSYPWNIRNYLNLIISFLGPSFYKHITMRKRKGRI